MLPHQIQDGEGRRGGGGGGGVRGTWLRTCIRVRSSRERRWACDDGRMVHGDRKAHGDRKVHDGKMVHGGRMVHGGKDDKQVHDDRPDSKGLVAGDMVPNGKLQHDDVEGDESLEDDEVLLDELHQVQTHGSQDRELPRKILSRLL